MAITDVKITYRRKDIYTNATGSGTISTTGSNLNVADGKIFNPQGGTGYITAYVVQGTKQIWNLYEFTYTGVSANTLTGVRIKSGTINYNTSSKVYPTFEILPDPLKLAKPRLSFVPDQTFVKLWKTGEKKGKLKGFYFRAELNYEYIDRVEAAKWMKLFDSFVEDIYFYPDRYGVERYRVKIVEPNVLDFQNLYVYRDFRIVLEGTDRLEHGYYLESNYWGSRDTNFDDRTARTGDGKSWYDIMIELNSGDEAINNGISTLKTNLQNHITSSTAHNDLYYTKSEIDSKIKNPIIYPLYAESLSYTVRQGSMDWVYCYDNSNVAWKILIPRDGKLNQIGFDTNYTSPLIDSLNLNVKRGDLMSVQIYTFQYDRVMQAIDLNYRILINGAIVHSNAILWNATGEPNECVVVILQI